MADEEAGMEEQVNPEFSPSMQTHILGLVLKDRGAFARLRPVLNPDYFDDESVSDVVAWAVQQWDTLREVPSRAALLDAFRAESHKQHRRTIKRAFEEEITDTQLTIHRATTYARNRAVKLATLKAAEYYTAQENGTPLKDAKGRPIVLDVPKMIRDAEMVGTDMNDLGDIVDMALIEKMAPDIINPPVNESFTTGCQHLDECGLRVERGEVGCVLGVAKGGKSFSLLNIGIGNVKDGRTVVYINLEIPQKRMLYRQFRRIAGPKVDQKTDPVAFVEKLKTRFPKLMKGKLVVKRMIGNVHSVADMRAYLTQLIAHGITPDVVIVDYLEIAKSSRPYDDKRFQLEQNWLDFRSLCQEFNVGGWSAAQTNRSGADVELVTMTQIGEAFAIVRHIDCGFSISMTQEERSNNQGRFFVFASRNEKDGMVIPYDYDFSVGIIQTKSIELPAANEPDAKGGKGGKRRKSSDEERENEAFEKARSARQGRDDHKP